MTEREKLAYLLELIQILEKAADRFATALGKPLILPEKGKERVRYADPDSRHFQVLKAVRVVSGLRASMILLETGHTQEIGVLLRTIQEFLEDITYVQEAHETGQPTAGQKDIINHFFESDLKTTKEMLEGQPKLKRVGHKEKVSSQSRFFSPVANSDHVRHMLNAIYNGLSGYVHGDYPQIMELYEANLSGGSEKFRMRGMLGTAKIKPFQRQIACYIHRSLNIFSVIAKVLGLNELSNSLIEQRKTFEKTVAYKE